MYLCRYRMPIVEEDEKEPPTPGAIQPSALAQVSAAVEKTMGGNIPKPPPMPPSFHQLPEHTGGGDTADSCSRVEEDGYDDEEFGCEANPGT